jgi:hypothetical protein
MSAIKIEWNRRNVMIGVGLTAATVAGFILVRRKVFGKKLAQYINAKLENRESLYGTVKDYEDIFKGQTYIDKINENVKQNHSNFGFLKLKDEYVTKYRKDLNDAMSGAGTDEEKVKAIIRKQADKVAIAQIAESYQKNYGRNLLDVMIDEMWETSDDMKEINDAIASKLPFRLTRKK